MLICFAKLTTVVVVRFRLLHRHAHRLLVFVLGHLFFFLLVVLADDLVVHRLNIVRVPVDRLPPPLIIPIIPRFWFLNA